MSDTAKVTLHLVATTGYESTSEVEGVTPAQYGALMSVLHGKVDVAKLQAAVQAMDQLFHAATNMYVHLVGDGLLPPADVTNRGKILDEAEAALRALGMIYEEDENTEEA